jgi:putative endonuclease
MVEKQFFVYILASRPQGAIYIGVSSNLIQRVSQHREGLIDGHTKKYNIKSLVYFEAHDSAESAILREKRLKKWNRAMKNDLIARSNPEWEDLYSTIIS